MFMDRTCSAFILMRYVYGPDLFRIYINERRNKVKSQVRILLMIPSSIPQQKLSPSHE